MVSCNNQFEKSHTFVSILMSNVQPTMKSLKASLLETFTTTEMFLKSKTIIKSLGSCPPPPPKNEHQF